MKKSPFYLTLLSLLFCIPTIQADEVLEQLLAKVPDHFNSVIYVNLEGLNNSPLGKKEDWAGKSAREYAEGTGILPPTLKQVIFTRHLDMSGRESSMEIGLAETNVDVSLDRIKAMQKGDIDMVAGKQVLLSPRGYFVPLETRMMALLANTNKQYAAQWIRSNASKKQITLPEHVKQAIQKGSEKAQLVMLLNLSDLIETPVARARLQKSKALTGKPVDRDLLARLIGSCSLVRLEVTTGEDIQFSLSLDFEQPINKSGEYLAALLNETLTEMGLEQEEFTKAKVVSGEKSVSLQGKLGYATLRHLMLLATPSGSTMEAKMLVKAPAEAPAKAPEKQPEDPKLTASMKYYKAANKLYDEFLTSARASGNYERTALLCDTYTKKMDRLDLIDVDPELINFCGRTTDRMRAIAASLRGVSIEVNSLEAQIRTRTYINPTPPINYFSIFSYPYPGGWAWGNYSNANSIQTDTNLPEVIAAQQKVIAAGDKDRQELLKQIENDRVATRKKMTVQFKTEFK